MSSIVGAAAHVGGALLPTGVGHLALSDVFLAEAAGTALLSRALAAAVVIGLAAFVTGGLANLALVAARSSSVGLLASLG